MDDSDAARVTLIREQIAEWRAGKQERGRLWLWTEMGIVCDALAAAEQERDHWHREHDEYRAIAAERLERSMQLRETLRATRDQLARLAALEAAARAYADRWEHGTDPEVGQARTALLDAVAALAPAEGAP